MIKVVYSVESSARCINTAATTTSELLEDGRYHSCNDACTAAVAPTMCVWMPWMLAVASQNDLASVYGLGLSVLGFNIPGHVSLEP